MYNGRFFGSNLKNPYLTEVALSLRAISMKAGDPQTLRSTLHDINNATDPAVLVIKMEDDFPTPVRSLDAVKQVYRGLY